MTPSCATCGRAVTPGATAFGLCAACLLSTALSRDPDSNLEDDGSLTTLAAGTIVGPFRIVRVLGRGGMATVYEARDGRLERAIALKVLPPEFLHDVRFAERFEQEARVVADLCQRYRRWNSVDEHATPHRRDDRHTPRKRLS